VFELGCNAVANDFGLETQLAGIPGELSEGAPFDVDFTATMFLSEEFIQAAEDTLGIDFVTFSITQQVIDLFGPTQATYTAVSGATGDDVTIDLAPIPFVIDLEEDTDGNMIPGPFAIPFPMVTGSFTAGVSGDEACFNFKGQATDPMVASETQIAGIASDGMFVNLPVTFRCEPADPDGLNESDVVCTSDDNCIDACDIDSCTTDDDCTASDTATCDTGTCTEGTCAVVIIPDPTAGQICFPIP
jgi:hypothetical protein